MFGPFDPITFLGGMGTGMAVLFAVEVWILWPLLRTLMRGRLDQRREFNEWRDGGGA